MNCFIWDIEINLEIKIKEIGDQVDITLSTPRISISERRAKEDIRPSEPRINILERDKDRANDLNKKSISRNSSSKRIIDYKSVQIPIYEDETSSMRMIMNHKIYCHALVQGMINTCITVKLYFLKYKPYMLDLLVDIGATKYIARKYCFPQE